MQHSLNIDQCKDRFGRVWFRNSWMGNVTLVFHLSHPDLSLIVA
jgi:hypothetical protein